MKVSQTPKEDQRVRLTRALLQDALLQLLAQKPARAVTVKELCERAGVNRGTFYLHYRDVPDLLEKMEGQLLDDLDQLLSENPVLGTDASAETSADFVNSLMRFFEKNREMCAVLLGENGDKKFVTAIIGRGRDKSLREYRQLFPAASRQKLELFYYFIAWGVIGLIQYFLDAPGAVSAKTLALGAERIITEAAGYLAAP